MLNQTYLQTQITTIDPTSRRPLLEILREIWGYRGLLWALCKRECKVRYSQTLLGPLWFVLYPLTTAGIFTIIFGLIVKIPSNGLPYLLFYLSAVILWGTFIFTVNNMVSVFLNNIGLIKKVYFPRILLVGIPMLIASLDFTVGFCITIAVSIFYHSFHWTLLLYAPLLLIIVLLFGTGLGLFLAPLNSKYRDISHLTPFALQCFYYASPIIYPLSKVPAWAKPWFVLNPLSTVINSFRMILGGEAPNFTELAATFLCAFGAFVIGCWYFIKQEKSIVDIL
jgi:lipopolysaccharide transport system permease protein